MAPYKRKTDRQVVTAEQMELAKKKLEDGKSKREVARELGINECTLRKRLKMGGVAESLGRYKKALTDEMERELAQHCRDLDVRFYGLTRKSIMKIAFDYAQLNNVADRFNQEKKVAGKDWLSAFCKRNNLSVRVPEKCSMARAMGFNKVQVTRFFDNLKTVCLEKKFPAHRKFNMDETGISTVPNKTPKVLTPKGKKTVCKISSAERGELITAVCCVSATGIYVPPGLIFPRKRMNPLLFKDAPPGSLPMVTETGYMNTELFVDWLKHFVHHTKPSAEDPVLLIADNHSSHCSLDAVLYCRANHVTFLTLPPHASHVIQPLDAVIHGPLKTAYAVEAEKWLVSHPGEVIKMSDVAGIFRTAYSATAKIKLAETAFKVTGIEPFDPDAIPEDQFAPSLVTDQPQDKAIDGALAKDNENPDLQSLNPELHNLGLPETEVEVVTIVQSFQPIAKEKPKVCIRSLYPLPKAIVKDKQKKRPSHKSEILTNSPFKLMLEEREREKKEKERAKIERTMKRKEKQKGNCTQQNNNKKTSKAKTQLFFDIEKPSTSSTQLNQSNQEEEDEEVTCPGCGQSFSDNWIQCGLCNEWWHEACSAYEGSGAFVCDHC